MHKIKPIRIKYILDNIGSKNIQNLEILDLGCGGGLVCESLAKLGCNVTGIDFVENNIKAAKLHASQNNLKIYKSKSAQQQKLTSINFIW